MPLFQIPRPVASGLQRTGLRVGWLPVAAKALFSSLSHPGFSLLSWKTSKPPGCWQGGGVAARPQVTGRRSRGPELLVFLWSWMESGGSHTPSQGKKMCSEAQVCEFLAAFFTLWEVFWDELDFYLGTQLCGLSLLSAVNKPPYSYFPLESSTQWFSKTICHRDFRKWDECSTSSFPSL